MAVKLIPAAQKAGNTSADAHRSAEIALKGTKFDFALAHALGIANTQPEVAQNELSMQELVREALNGFGSRAGWVPDLPR